MVISSKSLALTQWEWGGTHKNKGAQYGCMGYSLSLPAALPLSSAEATSVAGGSRSVTMTPPRQSSQTGEGHTERKTVFKRPYPKDIYSGEKDASLPPGLLGQ